MNKHAIPGLTTQIGRMRIVNGNVESLHKLRKVGRPKKTKNMPIATAPEFPGKEELRDAVAFDGYSFVAIGSAKVREANKQRNLSLQKRFDESASEVRTDVTVMPSPIERLERWHDGSWGRWDFDKVGRIERSVPSSFCSCKSNKGSEDWCCYDHGFINNDIACMVHGIRLDDCVCGGIDGTNGYRSCAGHRGDSR